MSGSWFPLKWTMKNGQKWPFFISDLCDISQGVARNRTKLQILELL